MVIRRAENLLKLFENSRPYQERKILDLPLFAGSPVASTAPLEMSDTALEALKDGSKVENPKKFLIQECHLSPIAKLNSN